MRTAVETVCFGSNVGLFYTILTVIFLSLLGGILYKVEE